MGSKKLFEYKKQKKYFIYAFLSIIVLAIIVVLAKNLPEFYTQERTQNLPLLETQRKRTEYEFEKILNEEFISIKNEETGFEIKYPSKMEVNVLNEKQAPNSLMYFEDKKPIGGLVLLLLSQTIKETELHDGLLIKIGYFLNSTNLTLDQIIQQETTSYDPKTGIGSRLEKKIFIQSTTGAKIVECCYGGKTNLYLFITKNGKYIIVIDEYSAGPDQKYFEKIAEKIINSIQINQ